MGGTTPGNVLIFRYPFETDSTLLKDELSKYGEVHDIRFRAWIHPDNVMDGARVIHMTRSGPIPGSLHVSDDLCQAWYRGMPISCDICEGSHKAQNCPFKGNCMYCCQEGHIQRDCPNAPNAWGTVDPTPAEAHSAAASSVPTPPSLPQSSAIILASRGFHACLPFPPVLIHIDWSSAPCPRAIYWCIFLFCLCLVGP